MAELDTKTAGVSHLEDDQIPPKVLVQDAAVGSKLEHELNAWEAIKAYPMAVFWCLILSMCVVMVSIPLRIEAMVILIRSRRATTLFSLATSLPIQLLRRSTENWYQLPELTS
jgi:hypothetical protein